MRPRGPQAVAVALCVALTGCGTASGTSRGALNVPPPTAPAADVVPATTPPPPSAQPRPQTRPVRPLGRPGGWRITTYYTAVQSFHGGKPTAVRGCPQLHCTRGRTPLGSYPADFLKIIQIEGSGRITAGPNKGRYLNWSHSVGWWLDDTTRDSTAKPLHPWSTAAADKDVLKRGQRFAVTGCGRTESGEPVEAKVCAAFRNASWTVTDLFRPGYGGEHHADVYIGEETGPGFKRFYTTLRGATLGAA
ncbi:hypothetical protein [Actinomadura macrotermitis]|uniref:Uncharacterized protein n=1 Tax=Actinomadura macrotermitis TaxID=2585200 RepID=A0A7K0C5U4_9ACTN|nr:hypothetical protein [Actinomadura macrotermitis]MQY08472.1 hypothetical protein [Actinomadura macrotermitis]